MTCSLSQGEGRFIGDYFEREILVADRVADKGIAPGIYKELSNIPVNNEGGAKQPSLQGKHEEGSVNTCTMPRSLVPRAMQSKTTVRSHFTVTRVALIKTQKMTSAAGCPKLERASLAGSHMRPFWKAV